MDIKSKYRSFLAQKRNWMQHIRENILATIVFKILDILGIQYHLPYSHTGEDAQELIFNTLSSAQPCMIARIGASEIRIMEAVLHDNCSFLQKLKYLLTLHEPQITSKTLKLWKRPDNRTFIKKFTKLMMQELPQLDVFASWRLEELGVFSQPYSFNRIPRIALEPFFSKNPWTRALKNKKVLVVNPFDETITKQYQKREKLFENPDILPEFHLITYKPFFKNNRAQENITDWEEQLEVMKQEISRIDFDIALISAGPFGFLLAADIKKNGKKAVVVGGVLQILFGIIGKRWERSSAHKKLFNQNWCRPDVKDRPENYDRIDGGCYW